MMAKKCLNVDKESQTNVALLFTSLERGLASN
jgi:hypothetical protein